MKKNIKLLLGFSIISGGIIYFFKDELFLTREKANEIIKNKFGSFPPSSYSDGYVKAWAIGIKNGKDIFNYQNKNYSTQTGKAV